MTTIDDLLAEITVREKTVKLLLRQDLLDEHARLDAELVATLNTDAEENRDPLGPELADRLLQFETEIEQAKRPFRFRAIGKKAWADLLAQHPPTRDQTMINARIDHNPKTFPAAAIAASCVDPKMTVEQVGQLEEKLNLAQFEILWGGCLDANVGGGVDNPKSLVAGPIVRARFALERSAMGMDDPSPDRSSSVE